MANTMNQLGLENILADIADVISARRTAASESSYVSQLLHHPEVILQKITQEAESTVQAAQSEHPLNLVRETADLWFHTLVLLAYHNLRPEDILMELRRRQSISGLDEQPTHHTK